MEALTLQRGLQLSAARTIDKANIACVTGQERSGLPFNKRPRTPQQHLLRGNDTAFGNTFYEAFRQLDGSYE